MEKLKYGNYIFPYQWGNRQFTVSNKWYNKRLFWESKKRTPFPVEKDQVWLSVLFHQPQWCPGYISISKTLLDPTMTMDWEVLFVLWYFKPNPHSATSNWVFDTSFWQKFGLSYNSLRSQFIVPNSLNKIVSHVFHWRGTCPTNVYQWGLPVSNSKCNYVWLVPWVSRLSRPRMNGTGH